MRKDDALAHLKKNFFPDKFWYSRRLKYRRVNTDKHARHAVRQESGPADAVGVGAVSPNFRIASCQFSESPSHAALQHGDNRVGRVPEAVKHAVQSAGVGPSD